MTLVESFTDFFRTIKEAQFVYHLLITTPSFMVITWLMLVLINDYRHFDVPEICRHLSVAASTASIIAFRKLFFSR
jgi:hypothetical protein